MTAPAARCEGLVSLCASPCCTDMHVEATAQFAASHMALGYELLPVTALHKNGISQFGVLMGILEGKTGDVAAAISATLMPALEPQPSSPRDNKQGPHSTSGSFRKLYALFPFARAT